MSGELRPNAEPDRRHNIDPDAAIRQAQHFAKVEEQLVDQALADFYKLLTQDAEQASY